MDFTWEALANAQRSLEELRSQISNLKRTALSQEKLAKVDAYKQKFNAAISNDLNMPQALAVVWEVVKSNIPSLDKHDVLMDFDEVLGLDLRREIKQKIVPEYIKERMMKRERLRRETKFAEADQIRREIEEAGYVVEDKKA